jgi:hypothetical protein
MSNHMESAQVEKFLVHMLNPIYRVLDDDFTKDLQMGTQIAVCRFCCKLI